MRQRVGELEGGTKFSCDQENYIRLSKQWVHAIFNGIDITPNAVRVRDGILVKIQDDAVATLAPKD